MMMSSLTEKNDLDKTSEPPMSKEQRLRCLAMAISNMPRKKRIDLIEELLQKLVDHECEAKAKPSFYVV